MRLINTTTLELHSFLDADAAPDYAILSHTWGPEEMNFKDFGKKRNCVGAGYRKIEECCRFARNFTRRRAVCEGEPDDTFEWVWIDTVCIDKSSSAELSEAINSMFRWYKKAQFCLAYLEDVSVESTDSDDKIETTLRHCRWFTRGWTLQELLAPPHVFFVDRRWRCFGRTTWHDFGDRDDPAHRNLISLIAAVSGIPERVVASYRGWCYYYSNATRLSWAATRRTSRKEDMAYCLMGLFGINMPLMYGEGDNAMQRLQLEIWNQWPDESLFAWDTHEKPEGFKDIPMLAPSTVAFKDSDNVGKISGTTNSVLSPEGKDWRLRLKPESPRVLFKHVEMKDHFILRLCCAVPRPEKGAIDRLPHFHEDFVKSCPFGYFHTDFGKSRLVGPTTEDQIRRADGWYPVQGSWDALIHNDWLDSHRCDPIWSPSRRADGSEHMMLQLGEVRPRRVALREPIDDGP